jgi:hypothetical protein
MNSNNIFSKTLKPNYKSTPMIKNSQLNLNNDEVDKEKDNLNKFQDKLTNIDSQVHYNSNQAASSNFNRKLTPKNTNIPKNMNFNLWRKPVMLGGGLPIQPSGGDSLQSKNLTIKPKQNNLKSSHVFNNNQTKDTTNILSTNNTESRRDLELVSEYNLKNVPPNLVSPKQSVTTKFKIKKLKQEPISPGRTIKVPEKEPETIHCNYYTNYNTTVNVQTDSNNIQSEILSSIMNFKTLLKSNEAANNIEKLFKSEEDLDKINNLNSKLNKYSEWDKMNIQSTIFKENKISLDEHNYLRRDTFVESSINKPINVINANMLTEYSTATRTKTEENEGSDKKSKIMNEIVTNSDMRLKRYEILLDFINSNLKEINQLMVGNNSENAESNTLIYNNQDEMQKIEEVNSNKLSSLHSKINLNSKFNLEDESSQFRKDNFHKPKEDSQTLINLEINANDSNCFLNKNNPEQHPSFLISSINSDFYQNFLEESFILQNDVSDIKLKKSTTKRVDRMLSYESDKTPLQYVSKQSNIIHPSHKPSHLEELNNISGDGEENLEDSDLDKTKENVISNDPRKVSYNQVVKDMERVKLFVRLF